MKLNRTRKGESGAQGKRGNKSKILTIASVNAYFPWEHLVKAIK